MCWLLVRGGAARLVAGLIGGLALLGVGSGALLLVLRPVEDDQATLTQP